MSWLDDKSVVTYQDLYDRTYGYGGSGFTLNSGQTITPTNECIDVVNVQTILDLDPTYFPDGVADKRQVIREWLIPNTFDSGTTGVITVDFYTESGFNLLGYCNTPGVDSFINNQIVYTGNNFFPNYPTTPDKCWSLASDLHGVGSPYWRFEFNLKKFLVIYSTINTFNFIIRGNASSSQSLNGAYVLHGANESTMIMPGSPGSYLPSVSGGTELGLTPFTSNIVSGATGSYDITTGLPILELIYNRSGMTMSAITY